MIMVVKKKKISNEKGQALVKFMLFLPFMLMMYSVTMSIGGAINASINQQKITRSYFYYRATNNPNIPLPYRDRASEPSDSWNLFGMDIIGWNLQLVNNKPLAPCFQFRLPFKEAVDDKCEERYQGTTTQFIRVKTVYGVCGATYVKSDGYNIPYPRAASVNSSINIQHCIIQ